MSAAKKRKPALDGLAAFEERAPGEGARDAIATHAKLRPMDVLRTLGPGVITGGADNDPSGITTYSVVGAQNGYGLNWLLLLSTPLLIAVQQMSAKIGSVTKTDLTTAIQIHYGRKIAATAVLLTVIANVLTIGADLLMMASVTQLITGINFIYFVVPYAVLISYVTIFWNYQRFSRLLLWLVAIFAAYIVAAFLAHPNWAVVVKQLFVPQIALSPTYAVAAVGLLGTTITPYLFFWQTSGEIEEKRGVQNLQRSRLDISAGMVMSNVIAFFIVVSTGSVLHSHHALIATAADIAKALQPFAGPYAKYLFAVGILGAGLLAIPVLAASTAYAVGGIFDWRRSLANNIDNAPHFYLVLGLAMLVGVELAIANVNPVAAQFYSQVLDGFVAPLLILLLLLLTSSRKVMGEFVNGLPIRIFGWAAFAVMVIADLTFVYSVATGGIPH